jgi:CubicO group peptidase (beta-lactamase class C family)
MKISIVLPRFLRQFVFFCLWFTVLLSVSFSVSAQAVRGDDEALETIDSALTSLVNSRDFSGSVLIARGDEVLFKKGYGYAVIEWEIPNAPDTVFRIGSITKQFTAMAVLKLQEAGLLDIDDLICDYLAECPDTWSEISIYHLLTHTSGLYSYTNEIDQLSQLTFSDISSEEVIDTFINLPLDFEPGSNWSYSNSGYHLLGDIIQQVSGSSYNSYLRDTFFEPLGMDSTDVESNTAIISHRAEGYVDRNTRADYLNMNVPYSAGALISTVEDLFVWQQALYNGQIVSEETLDHLWDRAVRVDESNRYGYGLMSLTMDGQDVIGHGGGIYGFSTFLAYLPEHKLTFIVLTNRQDGFALDEALEVIFDAMVAVEEATSP